MSADRHGARQPERFDPAKAAALEDPARFVYLPVEEVEALLDAPRGATLIDFGAGTGAYCRALARRRPDLRLVALDEQPRMLNLLRQRLADEPLANVRPVLAGGPEARALEGQADRVLALNVLHELGDAALESLAALLASQGRAVFIDWNADVERPAGPPRGHVYGPAEARARLAALGWRILCERAFPYHYALAAAR